jgi:hypothetical protein
VQLALTTDEWRKLRAWAAELDATVEFVVEDVLRRELERRPRIQL